MTIQRTAIIGAWVLLASPAAAQLESSLFHHVPLRAADPLIDHADIIGRVCFYDREAEGACAEDDPPVGGAVVALSSGFYAVSDERGAFHFRDVIPGQTLIKLDLASLPAGTRALGG